MAYNSTLVFCRDMTVTWKIFSISYYIYSLDKEIMSHPKNLILQLRLFYFADDTINKHFNPHLTIWLFGVTFPIGNVWFADFGP